MSRQFVLKPKWARVNMGEHRRINLSALSFKNPQELADFVKSASKQQGPNQQALLASAMVWVSGQIAAMAQNKSADSGSASEIEDALRAFAKLWDSGIIDLSADTDSGTPAPAPASTAQPSSASVASGCKGRRVGLAATKRKPSYKDIKHFLARSGFAGMGSKV